MKPILIQNMDTNLFIQKYSRLWVLLGLLLISGQLTHAQKLDIFLLSGDCWYQPAGQIKWKKLSNKDSTMHVTPESKIKLMVNAQLIVSQDQKTFLVNKPGVWRIGQLLAQSAKTPSLLEKYFTYLLDHLTHQHKSLDEYAEYYLRQKGLVSRGVGCTTPLMLIPEYDAALRDKSVDFKWAADPKAKSYTLAFYEDWNESTKPYWQQEVPAKTIRIDLDKALLEYGKEYFWCVYPTGQPNCARYLFKRSPPESLREFEKQLRTLNTQLKYDQAMNAFVRAGLYELNRFYGEANRQYRAALQLAPKNQLYRKSYGLFLARIGRVEEAKKWML
jgi:hypothetical protein